jgi:hypothetical protein
MLKVLTQPARIKMAKFTVRVELRNSKDADYDELHEKWRPRIFPDSHHRLWKYLLSASAEYSYKSDYKGVDLLSLTC